MSTGSMKRSHLIFGIVVVLIGLSCSALIISGQYIVRLSSLNISVGDRNIPLGNPGIFRTPKSEEITTFRMDQLPETLTLDGRREYRVVALKNGVFAQNVTVHAVSPENELPRNVHNTLKTPEYNLGLLRGRQLFDFKINETGDYRFEAHFLNLNNASSEIAIFPIFMWTNRIRGFVITFVFLGLLVGTWLKWNRPVPTREERQEKRNKWDQFIED